MILNALWIICSLPILTIGPATVALFSVTLKEARDESSATILEFFRAFRYNFKQAFLLGLIAAATALIIYVDAKFALTFEGSFRTLYLIITGIISALFLIYISYVFALNARFTNSVKGTIKNAFLLAFLCPGKTVAMWLIYAIPVGLILFLPGTAVLTLGIFFILFFISLPVYLNSGILRDIFDKISESSTSAIEAEKTEDTYES